MECDRLEIVFYKALLFIGNIPGNAGVVNSNEMLRKRGFAVTGG